MAIRHTVFRPCPMEPGQKIYVESGPRRGDWEVVAVDQKSVKLRCPISGKEVEWTHFCYFVETKEGPWPHED